ncbi:GAF domain-containing protein [Kineococcus radiotolerans]|uniref:Methyl-accepting chemotaxis sensory transducer n=1 Tax=Kineococcus radiotolerans (strain ATCC BAA-149 / DSM 14245 / SRS30216) TaxID=266940 RepID=A6W9C7_KINRD|nr:GAF domain-containing protein [Kineococcus radiotolerans]ABS03416.1 methyl-accepting chemotaxis sensory transducer [Kineococcus radiotolerans SRS30216 = ATCC BAA-149]
MPFRAVRRAQEEAAATTAESRANIAAIGAVITALGAATTSTQAVEIALDEVRARFGWAYASYWKLDPAAGVLRFQQESGDAGEEFRRVTLAASFAEGVGLSGRAWRTRDLVFVPDLAEVADCVRAPAAQRVGVKSGICFPLLADGRVVGTMDFFTTETLDPSPERLDTLRAIGALVSQARERIAATERTTASVQDAEALAVVLQEVSTAATRTEALGRALDAIRTGFGWAYASYWKLDPAAGVLRFQQESGDAGEEFRRVTLAASFAEGVGLSGRAWRTRDLVFVPDLAEVADCVRAPAAQRVGVKSGICFPVLVSGQVVGTMDFFATTTLVLSDSREHALRNTALLLGQALERFGSADKLASAGQELVASIGEVERNVVSATSVVARGQELTQEANRRVSELGESSSRISAVVKTIQAIAAQTNLLALNATIEAARAGETGRGFAVVADEVKELAMETATATKDVDERVRAIQEQVEHVVGALGQISEVVEEIDRTQAVISGVLTEQTAVTRAILG